MEKDLKVMNPESDKSGHRVKTVAHDWPGWASYIVGLDVFVCFENEADGVEWYQWYCTSKKKEVA